jgi:hypothetical protein
VRSIDALMTGLVDYAGLFPPASEDMRPALENYASYLQSPEGKALGRFIVPLPRLDELEESARGLLPRGRRSNAWRLSVLVAEDVRAAVEEILKFNRRHAIGSRNGAATIDVAELKASTGDEIARQHHELSSGLTTFFEIPYTGDISPLVRRIAKVGARAKIRTGGVTPEAFPPARAIIDFMAACLRDAVPFKATAGLHHPARGEYRLTYQSDSPKWMMYGFLNLFIAAALLWTGESEDTALAVLEESDPSAFTFEEDAIHWRDKSVNAEQVQACRREFAISFGSCSFREPIEELAQLTHRTKSEIQ